MSRLLIVSLAPSLDRYAWLPAMRLGTINRPSSVLVRAGGKGLNAARAAINLGVNTRIVALAGPAFQAVATDFDIRCVDSGAATRQCLCLLDDAGVLTEVYEPVLPVQPTVWPAVLEAVAAELPAADLLALSGRVPPGLPVSALAELVKLAHAHRVPVVVDSDGPALAAAVAARPTLIKVNEAEAAAADLSGQQTIITTGATGARFGRFAVTHEAIPDALPVGSGDAFLAGLAADWLRTGAFDPVTALPFAAAAARANARHLPAGDITPAMVEAELPAVSVTTLDK
ncbi:PfkB family carbohydrate kinase [Actinoplanes friuliensis]|uniref:PfkB domain-containing protein n=1 Tax=Actinoplanes friuliensis DSM 7358 TaxID=1246995 RepID=U5W755_9ACTN|nr:PfkB family carbohydrate kinase [Actinoplanes friuliensis]AGZ45028.1 PfkB domain-containing protein [Actinoplanes friuliensis DSM 7358]